MDKVEVISVWQKRPYKWTKGQNTKSKSIWSKVPVIVPYRQKMAMCIVTNSRGQKVTKHMFIDA
jgi:hypothetical protein